MEYFKRNRREHFKQSHQNKPSGRLDVRREGVWSPKKWIFAAIYGSFISLSTSRFSFSVCVMPQRKPERRPNCPLNAFRNIKILGYSAVSRRYPAFAIAVTVTRSKTKLFFLLQGSYWEWNRPFLNPCFFPNWMLVASVNSWNSLKHYVEA
jgi:hypothetical protein